jgi:hypothetical protein
MLYGFVSNGTSCFYRELFKRASNFEEYKFVEAIELIPSLYIEEGGGFSNLDQLRKLFDIEGIPLLSYDQSQFNDTRALSITYWTIIGAYIVREEKNDTHFNGRCSFSHSKPENAFQSFGHRPHKKYSNPYQSVRTSEKR